MRGQIFSLDVFIAAVVLVGGTSVLLFSIVGSTSLHQAQLFGSDLLRETLTTPVRDLNYEVLTSPSNGYANASNEYDIRNYDLTLGELIGEYHYLANKSTEPVDIANYTLRRNDITERTIASLITSQYSYTISIGDFPDDMELLSSRMRIAREDADFVVASRSVLAAIDRDREFFGPYTFEVVVWN